MSQQPPEMPSDEELAAIMRLHRKSPEGLICLWDGEFWQCPTRRAVNELRYRRGNTEPAHEGDGPLA